LIAKNFNLAQFDGLSVPCTLRLPRQRSSGRLVIVVPGFLGFKGQLPHAEKPQLNVFGVESECSMFQGQQ
jgi:hypothetical protein